MQNFGNHMENRDITQIRYNIHAQNVDTWHKQDKGQRGSDTLAQNFNFKNRKGINNSRGVIRYIATHKILTFLHISRASKECTQ